MLRKIASCIHSLKFTLFCWSISSISRNFWVTLTTDYHSDISFNTDEDMDCPDQFMDDHCFQNNLRALRRHCWHFAWLPVAISSLRACTALKWMMSTWHCESPETTIIGFPSKLHKMLITNTPCKCFIELYRKLCYLLNCSASSPQESSYAIQCVLHEWNNGGFAFSCESWITLIMLHLDVRYVKSMMENYGKFLGHLRPSTPSTLLLQPQMNRKSSIWISNS